MPDASFVDLERPQDYAHVVSDIELFLDECRMPVIVDEAQRLPALFPALRHALDKQKAKGRVVLLGSASPPLLHMAAEALTGRLAVLELSPFSCGELAGTVSWMHRWMFGGLPPLYHLPSNDERISWLEQYVSSFLERELAVMGIRTPAVRLRQCWGMLTHLHGQQLCIADLATSLGVSARAVMHYLDLLEHAHMIRRLPPFFAHIGKRLVKQPKVYIRDSGILHYLAGLRAPGDLETWPGRGRSFEGLVVEELIARGRQELSAPEFFFWRTSAGAEVDLLVKHGRDILAFEIKHAAAVNHYDVMGLRHCMADLNLSRGVVVARVAEQRSLGHGITVMPWDRIVSGLSPFEA